MDIATGRHLISYYYLTLLNLLYLMIISSSLKKRLFTDFYGVFSASFVSINEVIMFLFVFIIIISMWWLYHTFSPLCSASQFQSHVLQIILVIVKMHKHLDTSNQRVNEREFSGEFFMLCKKEDKYLSSLDISTKEKCVKSHLSEAILSGFRWLTNWVSFSFFRWIRLSSLRVVIR